MGFGWQLQVCNASQCSRAFGRLTSALALQCLFKAPFKIPKQPIEQELVER